MDGTARKSPMTLAGMPFTANATAAWTEENELTIDTDVFVEYASEHAEVISKAKSGGYEVVLLPEPFVTQMKTQSDSWYLYLSSSLRNVKQELAWMCNVCYVE